MPLSRGRTLEEELALRRRKHDTFGGSDAPKVFGFSDYADALDVYHAKTRPVDVEEARAAVRERNVDLYRGHAREREAVHLYLDERGRDGRHERRQIRADATESVAVHVDGTIYRIPPEEADPDDPFRGTGVVEVKAPRVGGFRRVLEDGVPTRHTVQAQFNAAVCGRDWCAIVYYCDQHDDGPIRWAEVEADPDLGELMIRRARLFMKHHVAGRVPPDPERWDISDDADTEDVLLDRETEYRDVEDPSFVEGIGRPLVDVYRAYREAKQKRDDLRTAAREWLEEHEETDAARLPDGSKIRIVRKEPRVTLQKDQLREHRPVDRDALERAIREGALLIDDPRPLGVEDPEDVDAVLEALELDFERFEREGSPSAYVSVYPSKDEE